MVDPRGISTATLEFMRDTSRRFSADLQDMKSDFGRECRGIGREIKGLGAKMRGSAKELPRLAFANNAKSSSGYQELSKSQRNAIVFEDDDDPLWSTDIPLSNEISSPPAPSSPVTFSPILIRSPKTQEILKNIGDTFQKTDKVVRDMFGLDTKEPSNFKLPDARESQTVRRVVAPAPPSSPACVAPIFSLDD